jgi:hypothetical protein
MSGSRPTESHRAVPTCRRCRYRTIADSKSRNPGKVAVCNQRAVGPLVTSECNIFALSVKHPSELPADIRSDLMAFKSRLATDTR